MTHWNRFCIHSIIKKVRVDVRVIFELMVIA